MIKVDNVHKTYEDGTHAVNGMSLTIKDGEFVYITGATGSGKSTLIRLINAEVTPNRGRIEVGSFNVGKLKKRKIPMYRRTIGVVFQNYRLLPKKTVFENVAFALEVADVDPKKIRPRVREVLKLVGLTDKSTAFPHQLSGGQQQRVAIARAIANRPKVLIADEPTGNLDPETSDNIITLFEKINSEQGTTVLIVTHDTVVIKNHPNRTIHIEEGHISADGLLTEYQIDKIEKEQEEASKENNDDEFSKNMEEYKQEVLENTLHKNKGLFDNFDNEENEETKQLSEEEDEDITRTISMEEFEAKGLVHEDTEEINFAKEDEDKK